MCKKIKNNRQFAVSCAEEVGEQLNMLSCFSTWSSSELTHIATTHCFQERGKHLTREISVPVCVAQHRCPLWLWGLTKGSAGVPVCASQGSVHPQHMLNAFATACGCTLVMWCGSQQAARGSAKTWATDSPTSVSQVNWCLIPHVGPLWSVWHLLAVSPGFIITS